MRKTFSIAGWPLLALLGAGAYAVLAFKRGEPVNSAYLLIAAVCTYAIGYRFYSQWIALRVLGLENRRATPCEVHDDGKDFVRTNKFILFGHHFAAIAGPGPLVGPVLAAQFGYLPGALWILIGVVLGGAATLAVGMAHIFSKAVNGRWLDLWYHFAVMFEALFILTTLDAGTRVGRYLLQGVLGKAWKPLGDPKNFFAAPVAAALMVGGWGYFLIQGVRDPLGGINSLWPLFGIANQMLAAIALCLGTTIILKMVLADGHREQARPPKRISFALVTLIPLVWLLAVTFTAGVEKIWSADPRIGFLAQASALQEKESELLAQWKPDGSHKSETKNIEAQLPILRAQYWNNVLDAAVAGTFLALVLVIVLLSVREWVLLFSRRKPAVLHETAPVWLPDYALKESGPNLRTAAGAATIALGLAKELSGETQLERARQTPVICTCHPATAQQIYVATTEAKFNGVRRCC